MNPSYKLIVAVSIKATIDHFQSDEGQHTNDDSLRRLACRAYVACASQYALFARDTCEQNSTVSITSVSLKENHTL
jgi:hypothetical protein